MSHQVDLKDDRLVNQTGVGVYDHVRDVLRDEKRDDVGVSRIDQVVHEMIAIHDMLDVDTPDEVPAVFDEDYEIPVREFDRTDNVTTISLERTTNDSLLRKMEELDSESDSLIASRTETIEYLIRIHDALPSEIRTAVDFDKHIVLEERY